MDNYKILNSYTNKIIKLLNELGYAWVPTTNDSEASLLKSHWILAESSGDIAYSSTDSFYEQDSYKELSFGQLNDLVVLKRNDVKDATHTDGNRKAFLDSAGKYHYWCFHKNEWIDSKHIAYLIQYLKPIQTAQAVLNDLDELREAYKDYHKDPALISGAEAKIAWANGKEIEYQNKLDSDAWIVIDDTNTLGVFSKDQFVFRLKPQTIKLELELPKPFEPKNGEMYWWIDATSEEGYSYTYFDNNKADQDVMQFGAYRTEDDVKKEVEQLRKIRGTNS